MSIVATVIRTRNASIRCVGGFAQIFLDDGTPASPPDLDCPEAVGIMVKLLLADNVITEEAAEAIKSEAKAKLKSLQKFTAHTVDHVLGKTHADLKRDPLEPHPEDRSVYFQ
jgi:hypothetical protein